MCRTSFFTLWVQCGHSSLEDNRCNFGNCVLEVPTYSLEHHSLCRVCRSNSRNILPVHQRVANHQQSQARIAQEQAAYAAQLHLQAALFEQQRIMALERERREEEQALSQIPSHTMTVTQAQRIRFLYNAYVEIFQGGMATDMQSTRFKIIQRALFNIPTRLMDDWTVQDLEAQSEALIDDTAARGAQCRRSFEEFDARKSRLTSEECRTIIGSLTNQRRDLDRDYAKYLDLTVLIHDRNEQERIRKMQSRQEVKRSKAISQLLQHISMKTLQTDMFSQRCTICMETYGTINEDGQVEQPCCLPCGHVFGTACLSTWLMEHDTCGVCRRNYWVDLGSLSPTPAVDPEEELLDGLIEEHGAWPLFGEEQPQDIDIPERRFSSDLVHSPASFEPFLLNLDRYEDEQDEFIPHGFDADNEELEFGNHDDNPFMAWGLSSQEDLSMEQEIDGDQVMRMLDDEPNSYQIMED